MLILEKHIKCCCRGGERTKINHWIWQDGGNLNRGFYDTGKGKSSLEVIQRTRSNENNQFLKKIQRNEVTGEGTQSLELLSKQLHLMQKALAQEPVSRTEKERSDAQVGRRQDQTLPSL